jgi:CRP-like cAMP-binding protein
MLDMNYVHRDFLPELRGFRMERTSRTAHAVNLLTPEQQIRLQSISTLVDIRRGGLIFGEGSPADFLYSVANGMARISRCSQSGRRQVLAFMMPGDMFGFPEQGVYVNSARAVGAATLYRIPWLKLMVLLRRDAELHNSFLTRLAFDLRLAQKRIMALGQQNVAQRLASFLLELIERADFYDPQRRQLSLQLTRFDLADYLGTTPETVVRVMARLEQDGLIRRLTARLLEIRSAEGLSGLLEERRRNG